MRPARLTPTPGMSEKAYRRHMFEVSAPLTEDLMVKYGVRRWTVSHNPLQTRALMMQLFDRQMANVADYDCFSQVVFESLEHYKAMKADPYYQRHLFVSPGARADTFGGAGVTRACRTTTRTLRTRRGACMSVLHFPASLVPPADTEPQEDDRLDR